MKASAFAVKQPVATLMLFLALALLGSYALTRLNVDMYPNIEPPVVSVITSWPGAGASDVETELTEIIEDNVNSVNNLDTLSSKSLDNLSIVSCRFDWGTDLDVASNDLRDALDIALRDLPEEADPPIPFKFSSATAPIMFMTITAVKNQTRLYHFADTVIGDHLRRVPGVGAIVLYGGLRRRINVYFDRAKIEGYRLSLSRINQVLAAENRNIPAGTVKNDGREYFVRIPARYQSMQDLRNTVAGYHEQHAVYLKDVARVEDAFAPQEINGWGDGQKGVVLMLQKQTGKNTVKVAAAVKQAIQELNTRLPPDITINIITDTSKDIINAVSNLRTSLFWGIGLIILVSLAFLRRFRTVFIVVLIIPFSLIIAFLLMFAFSFTINVVTLMALAIAAGLVIDNGIVVLENIIRHLEQGEDTARAAVDGASEMGLAITAATMTTVVIFVPLMFLTGLAGIIFKPLGFVLVATLLASLLVSLMLTPMLCSRLLGSQGLHRKTTGLARLYSLSERLFLGVENGYQSLLHWSLNHSKIVLVSAVIIFFSGLSLIPFLSTSFLPEVDTGQVEIRFRLPEGTAIEETNRVILQLLDRIKTVVKPGELLHTYAYDGESEEGFGQALGFDQGPNVGYIGLRLVDRGKRTRTAKTIAEVLRREAATIPGLDKIQVSAESSTNAALAMGQKPVTVEIQGEDLQRNIRFAEQLKTKMSRFPGLVDVQISQKDPRPEIRLEINRDKASSLGLNTALIGRTLRNYLYGVTASQFRDAGERFDMVTRFTLEDKNRLDAVEDLPLFTPDGRMIRLKTVARVVRGTGPIEIQRKDRQRIVKVEAGLYEMSLGQAKQEIKALLADMAIPPGTDIAFGGDIEEQKKAFTDLTTLLIVGILLVYMLMASLFGNLRDPFIIMFAVPFAFTGVLYAFYFSSTTLGIMSFMGIVMLMGIVVNNAIVLLDYTHLLQRKGQPLLQAVIQAGHDRLRPVLMTTMTTFFGMLPMAVSDEVGAEAWNPLGITMLGGLAVSTLVSLVLVPTIYYLMEGRKHV
ncbi:MAG: efflux RND transporter permease subunit [Desulfohalobiaceae bacterium]|nr:efflux RND transporter permease subunit [Desulfohalobiaceae bacterium]